jgi:hypothetical protein
MSRRYRSFSQPRSRFTRRSRSYKSLPSRLSHYPGIGYVDPATQYHNIFKIKRDQRVDQLASPRGYILSPRGTAFAVDASSPRSVMRYKPVRRTHRARGTRSAHGTIHSPSASPRGWGFSASSTKICDSHGMCIVMGGKTRKHKGGACGADKY